MVKTKLTRYLILITLTESHSMVCSISHSMVWNTPNSTLCNMWYNMLHIIIIVSFILLLILHILFYCSILSHLLNKLENLIEGSKILIRKLLFNEAQVSSNTAQVLNFCDCIFSNTMFVFPERFLDIGIKVYLFLELTIIGIQSSFNFTICTSHSTKQLSQITNSAYIRLAWHVTKILFSANMDIDMTRQLYTKHLQSTINLPPVHMILLFLLRWVIKGRRYLKPTTFTKCSTQQVYNSHIQMDPSH